MKQKIRQRSPKNGPKNSPPTRDFRNVIWYFLIGLLIVTVLTSYFRGPKEVPQIDLTEFTHRVTGGKVREVSIRPQERLIEGKTKDGKAFKTYYIEYPEFVSELRDNGVKVTINTSDTGWVWNLFVQGLLPFILIAALWFFIFRQAQGANNQALTFGKSRAVAWDSASGTVVTFNDVAGVNEAVIELQEIVDYLKSPAKYQEIGAKIPKGVLLMGPPGTGKTLLARAVAGEAGVPFFSLSGSDFVEMFVGVGASRVRDLFGQAKKSQPCIIFLDEIDAVGRQRGAGLGGGHDEREQTLNQLLVEMDGFDAKNSIIVIAATNRPDILDPALLRPGRFDRQVVVDKPDLQGRLDILKIHTKDKKVDPTVELEVIARRTPGFTGADLANLVNEAALLSARKGHKIVSITELEESIDRVLAGPERKSRLISERERQIVAYHEVGHALVAIRSQYSDPVHKISILPRGRALGYTLQLPERDKNLVSRDEIEDQIRVLLGGRIAEELKFNSITSGASNDIDRATELARSYVCSYGMSEKLGMRRYGKSQGMVFLAKDYGDHSKDYSEKTAREIDEEIKSLIDRCYADATQILKDDFDQLESISKTLMQSEVIDADQFKRLLGLLPEDETSSIADSPVNG
jgi:cell division protease FtsH